ncbi:hypothetical protein MAJ_11521, partial [Metarhizium majus ARSEF 297]
MAYGKSRSYGRRSYYGGRRRGKWSSRSWKSQKSGSTAEKAKKYRDGKGKMTKKDRCALERLQLESKYGPSRALGVKPDIEDIQLLRSGAGRNYYLTIPVSEILHAGSCHRTGKSSVFVTGISLRSQVLHSSPVDFDVVLVSYSPGQLQTAPVELLEGGSYLFSVRDAVMDQKTDANKTVFLDADHPRVRTIAESAFGDVGSDGTFFGAPLNKANVFPGDYSWNNSKKKGHKGRMSVSMNRVGGGCSTEDLVLREKGRQWFKVEQMVEITASSKRLAILCAIRAQVDGLTGDKSGQGFGFLKDLKVDVYIRDKP